MSARSSERLFINHISFVPFGFGLPAPAQPNLESPFVLLWLYENFVSDP